MAFVHDLLVPRFLLPIRFFVTMQMRNASDNGVISKTTSYQVAYGDSALFKVNMINTRPVKMKVRFDDDDWPCLDECLG